MGLDMYLYQVDPQAPPCDPDDYDLGEEAGYWRKANAVHGWIVRHCADGVDECQATLVSREQARELLLNCHAVILAPEKDRLEVALMADLLPTEGFFFGSYDLDDWYLRYLRDTVTILDKVLGDPAREHWPLVYQASW